MSNDEQPPAQPAVPPVPRPAPRYGEYADPSAPPPVVSAPPAPAYPGYAEQPQPWGGYPQPVKKSRTWDLVLTIILLVVGLFGMLIGLLYGVALLDPALVRDAMAAAGYEWDGSVGNAGIVIVVSHLLLYLAAVGISIPLLVKKKVAFWAPLGAGVIAAIIFWGAWYTVLLSDPSFIDSISRVS
jgi:hypothetical protein